MSIHEGSAVQGMLWVPCPVVAITSSWDGKVNGQIATSIAPASIVSSVPRVFVGIWKRNYTHEFIMKSKSFAVHLLRKDQLALVKKFGFYTGREVKKFTDDIEYEIGVTGSPLLQDAFAYIECKIINAMDGGDMTCILAEVVDGRRLSDDDFFMTYDYFCATAPRGWLEQYGNRLAESVAFSLERIHNIDRAPWIP